MAKGESRYVAEAEVKWRGKATEITSQTSNSQPQRPKTCPGTCTGHKGTVQMVQKGYSLL